MSFLQTVITEVRVAWLLVGVGVAALGVSPLLLARMRWVQSRRITSCVVLSVLAHLLLVVIAYLADLFAELPPVPPGHVFQVSIAAEEEPSAAGDNALPERRPWDAWPTSIPRIPAPAPQPRPHVKLPADEELFPLPVPKRPSPAPLDDPPVGRPAGQTPPPPVDLVEDPVPVSVPPFQLTDGAPEKDVGGKKAQDQSPAAAAAAAAEMPQTDDVTADDVTADDVTADDVTADDVTADGTHNVTDIPPDSVSETALISSGDAGRSTVTPSQATGTMDAMASGGPSVETNRTDSSSDRTDRAGEDGTQGHPSSSPQPTGDPLSVALSVRRRVDGRPVPRAYQQRTGRERLEALRQRGGNGHGEQAVRTALRWLADCQQRDGRWDAATTEAGREYRVGGHDRGGAGGRADTAITGLAVLTFLGAGHTHLEGSYREVVQHSLEFLLGQQASDGNLAGRAEHFAMMYCHGIATLAISEGYAVTGDPRMEPYVRRAVDYTVRSQHPTSGGWRYVPGDVGDTSQFGWQLMALRTAELGGIPIPERNRQAMHHFLRTVSSGRYGGLAAYRPTERGKATHSMTAEAMVCRLFLGAPPDDPAVSEAADFVLQYPPGTGQANLYYWYYATLGLSQLNDQRWQRWNLALLDQLLSTQRTEGPAAGSWDPDTVWGGYGGRVYSTALAALCLEVYYRYPMFSQLP